MLKFFSSSQGKESKHARSSRPVAKGRSPERRSGEHRGNERNKPAAQIPDGFWHQPTLVNLTADLLIILASAALAWAAVIALQRLPFFPLKEIVVVGNLSHVQREQIESAAKGVVKGNFFTVNLDAARLSIEKLPWVRRAEVRRHWPDGVDLVIEEHVPVAQWRSVEGEPRLVNSFGEVFLASPTEVATALPIFVGPEGSSARVLSNYKSFSVALAQMGRQPRVIALSPREAWQLRLDNGLVLELGRDQTKLPLTERLARFTQNYQAAAARSHMTVATVDMRYPNGFSLRPARADKANSGNT